MVENNEHSSTNNRLKGVDPPGMLPSSPALILDEHYPDGDDDYDDNDNYQELQQESQVILQQEHQQLVLNASSFDQKHSPMKHVKRDDDTPISVHSLSLIQHSQLYPENSVTMAIEDSTTETTRMNCSDNQNNDNTSKSSLEVYTSPPPDFPSVSAASSQQQAPNDDNHENRRSYRSIGTTTITTEDTPVSPRSSHQEKQRPQSPPAAHVITNTKPTMAFGAYRVTKIRSPNTNQYKVVVPESVQPGTDFLVEVPEVDVDPNSPNSSGNRRVQVRCPEEIVPGDPNHNVIDITVPVPAVHWYHSLKVAQVTTSPTTSIEVAGTTFPMLKSILKINEQATNLGGIIRTQVITIPDHAIPGKEFSYHINGHIKTESDSGTARVKKQKLKIPCPDDCKPGDRLRIVLPAEIPEPEPTYQIFNVIVPDGVVAGGQFAVEIGLGNAQQVLVECPENANGGDVISIQLPTRTVVDKFQALTYPSTGTGWKRTVRLSDLHFQWVRLEESIVRPPSNCSGTPTRVNGEPQQGMILTPSSELGLLEWTYYHEKAYVRKLVHLEGNDPRLRTASVTLVSAEASSSPSKLKTSNGILLFSYADIAHQQGQPLQEKHKWFLDICQNLSEYASTTTTDTTNTTIAVPTDHTMSQSVLLLVRRDRLLTDSLRAILSFSIDDMRRNWEIVFVGESGIDQGGLTKEWLQCVTEQIFLPSTGLFLSSLNNQAAVDINPASDIACPNYHLLYYRFVGRVLGRALFSGQLIHGHFVRLLYKHLLGWPITIEDVRDQDDRYYTALHEVINMDDSELASVCLVLAAYEEYGGKVRLAKEFTENGANVTVNRDNLSLYVEASIRYRLFDRILPQLTELLLGFYDVVPEQALAVFDANELELVLCGLPLIKVDDWQSNTSYVGIFETGKEQTVTWFWEIVRYEYDIEMKARLLQFVTGTSGVPPGGFAFLKGGDDTPRKFTIQGVETSTCIYPKAHTCFNVLDLPNYATKEELQKLLTFSITTSYVGFDAE